MICVPSEILGNAKKAASLIAKRNENVQRVELSSYREREIRLTVYMTKPNVSGRYDHFVGYFASEVSDAKNYVVDGHIGESRERNGNMLLYQRKKSVKELLDKLFDVWGI